MEMTVVCLNMLLMPSFHKLERRSRMNLKIKECSVVLLALFVLITCKIQETQKSETDFNPLTGPYIGQKPPGMTPEVFEPKFVSTGLDELNSVFSPDGREFYFCVRNFLGAVSIFQMTMEGETWSQPKLLPFASRYGDIDVTMSPDGNKLLFSSRRPIPGSEEPRGDYDFWMVERTGNTWGEPIHLSEDINSDSHDYYPMITNSGVIYFSSQREGPGTNNIYRSELVDGKYAKAVKLGEAINTEHREFDPYISPDESILIFTSNRPEGLGSGDLYISFKDRDGKWMKARHMGDKINTPGSEYCPMISPDGKYLLFTSAGRGHGRKVRGSGRRQR